MCSDITIEVKNIGKCFQIYKKPHERLLQSLMRGRKNYYKDFWALRDVSFHVRKGETVGIVGRNGSGKTTLLQLVCGTLVPTQGECKINGRVAALLALGAGFNPDYSGEENINLYASLLGLNKQEIDGRYDDICQFADIGEFISQPVKKYSSGMYMRLAFAIAVHVEPQILIVDEALAVGDEAFQRKCYAKLDDLKKCGMTLLFVSHSASSIISLCDRAVLLEKGKLLASGSPKNIISAYHKLLFSPASKVDEVIKEIESNSNDGNVGDLGSVTKSEPEQLKRKAYFIEGMVSKSILLYESNGAEISEPCITTPEGKVVNVLCKGEHYIYTYKVAFSQECYRVRFGMLIKTTKGIEVGGFATSSIQSPIDCVKNNAEYCIKYEFICRLNPGVYFLNAGVKGIEGIEEGYLHRIIDAIMIRVMPEDEQQSTGIVDFEFKAGVKALN